MQVGSLTCARAYACRRVHSPLHVHMHAGGIVYLWLLSQELCLVTLSISAILWLVTLFYGDFARKAQKASAGGAP